MPWETIEVRRPITFVPPEATRIASTFRAAAADVRALAGQSQSSVVSLDPTWEGRSHTRFHEEYHPGADRLAKLAEWLDDAASRIARIEVTIWETVQERVWIREPVGPWN